MSRIVSSMLGRIRVRDKRLCDRQRLTEMKQALATISAITAIQDSVRTGSIVVNFDATAIDIASLETLLDAAVDQVLNEPFTAPPISKKQFNRYNKIAMAGSLAASLALTLARKKHWRRWHAFSGYMFVASVAAHMVIYRKTLFK